MAKHPLDEALNLESADRVSDVFGMDLELPDNPNMTSVVNLALKAYKELVDDSKVLDPEDRITMLALAKEYLDLAKDTMYKESDLAIKSRKNDIQEKRQAPKSIGSPSEDELEQPKELSYDDVMSEIYEEREKARKGP